MALWINGRLIVGEAAYAEEAGLALDVVGCSHRNSHV